MDYGSFVYFLQELNDYYGLDKIFSPSRKERWHNYVKYMPNESLKYIRDRIFDEKETIPRNIPMWMKNYFRDWKVLNSGRFLQYTPVICDECGTIGLFWITAELDGIDYTSVAVCKKCENWQLHLGPETVDKMRRATRAELEAEGYSVFEVNNYKGAQKVPAAMVSSQTHKIGKKIPK